LYVTELLVKISYCYDFGRGVQPAAPNRPRCPAEFWVKRLDDIIEECAKELVRGVCMVLMWCFVLRVLFSFEE